MTNEQVCKTKGYELEMLLVENQEELVLNMIRRWREELLRDSALGMMEQDGSFDWAVPQEFADFAQNEFGISTVGNVVWWYPITSEYLFGAPVAISADGQKLLGMMSWRAYARSV